jgi:hypothetical protein
MRHTFAETLVDLVQATQPAPEIAEWLRVTELFIDMPIEMAVRREGDETEFFAHAPRWRWRTPFDEIPSRLRITWAESLPV